MTTIETFTEGHYRETVERECVRDNELDAFHAEVERVRRVRTGCVVAGDDWEPTVIRLLWGDIEIERRLIA